MKIYFSPEYSGQLYIKPEEGTVMMDTVAVNVIGLVNLLELRMGLHYEEVPEHQRIAAYYGAMCEYMKKHPNNVMSASFKNSPLNTAKAVLVWRDELRDTGWNFDGKDISRRIQVLVDIEETFSNTMKHDVAGRLHTVTEQVTKQKLDCKEMEIYLPFDRELLKPTIATLLETLTAQGAIIRLLPVAKDSGSNLSKVRTMLVEGKKGKIRLDKDDDSFLIYKFPDEHLANEYLAYKGERMADVWISADNKQMDNWLSLMGKPATGSVAADCSPQLTQMFVMGVGLFDSPLNVNTLIAWLNMPKHPLSKYFRQQLAGMIATEGGYRNEKCQQIIEQYIAGDFVYLDERQRLLPEEEQHGIRMRETQKRKHKVEVFLPPMERRDKVDVEALRLFVDELASWANQQAHLLDEDETNLMWVEQLHAVATMCEALSMLLNTLSTNTTDYHTVDNWLSSIYEKADFTNSVAQVGSRPTVDSPAKIISVADTTIWNGVDGDTRSLTECAFLYPTERKALMENHYMRPWKVEKQNKYQEQCMLNAFQHTAKQMILVVCEHRSGEQTEKHPLMVRLEQQIENLEEITRYPHFDKKEMAEVKIIDNGGIADELKFNHADKITWPDHLSPTNIGILAEYPFDFLMQNLLHIEPDAEVQMQELKLVKGNVAHAVIEALFAPKEEGALSTPQEIKERIDNDFDTVYTHVIEAKGAILLLAENKLAEKLLKEQLRRCLDVLLEIITHNMLRVKSCEQFVEEELNLGLPKKLDKEDNVIARDMLGYIDMTLVEEDDTPVAFDFKWTSSRSYYQGLLKENRSVQLEFYRHMLSRQSHKDVEKVAYFLMPQARLYSQEDFDGPYCTQISPENADDIVAQLRNAAIFRKAQLDNGIVETNGVFSELDYVKRTGELNLYPLKEEKGLKEENKFTQYKLFNA